MKKLTRIATILSISTLSALMVTAALAGAARSARPDGQARESVAAPAGLLEPSIILTKTVSMTPDTCGTSDTLTVQPGTEVLYCFEVSNTGDVTFTSHTLDDDQLGLLLEDEALVLPPGESYTYSATAEITDDVTNIAVWTADDGIGGIDDAQDTATVTIFDPTILLSKTVNATPGACPGSDSLEVIPGATVNYCYTVTNTGPVTLTHHTLTDDQLGPLIPVNTAILLPPAASYTFSITEVITEDIINVGIWTANDGFGHLAVDNEDASVTVLSPSIVLTKTVSADPGLCAPTVVVTVTSGSSVTYCYEIENTGQVTVTSHSLVDDVLGALFTDTLQTVGPGETMVFSTTVPVNVDTTNTATWTAEEPFGSQAQSVDSATVNVITPGVDLSKTVTADLGNCPGLETETVLPGTMVTYCFLLENTGTTTLTTHTLVDDHLGTILSGAEFDLGPGATHTVTVNSEITQPVTNLATWTAVDEFENELETSDAAEVQITGVSVDLSKTVGTSLAVCSEDSLISVPVGTTVLYCYEIENTGLVTLTTHTLFDSELGLLLNGAMIEVPPGQSYTYSETVVINASVTNEAIWTALDMYTNPAVSSDSATVNIVAPGILVTPQLLFTAAQTGETVTRTLYISNTGTVALTWSAGESPLPSLSAPTESGGLGEVLFKLDFGAQLGNEAMLGVEFDGSSFWVTAGGVTSTSEPNLLYEFDRSGSLLNTFTNTVDSAGFGWRDLAFDGSNLYASAGGVIDEIDRTDGQPTGTTIDLANTGLSLARAIAYDPATDHFWVANFNSQIYEIDRGGLVITTIPNIGSPIYGLAWDDVSPGGPFLWAWTADNPPQAFQIDPDTGQTTGVSFTGATVPGGAGGGGATISADVYADRLVLIGMHQATGDTVIGYDLGVETGLCNPGDLPWFTIAPTGGVIGPSDGIAAEVVFDSTGLDPGLYQGHLCISSTDADNPLIVVDVQFVVHYPNVIQLPAVFHIFQDP